MIFKKFDIVLVDFPFTDLSITKKRPALVIKNFEGNNSLLCQITTKKRRIQKYEIKLSRKYCNGDIRFDSYIYLDIIFTLHKNLIYKKIADVTDLNMKNIIENKIREIFIC